MLSVISDHVGDKQCRDSGPKQNFTESLVKHRKNQNDSQEYPDHVIYSLARTVPKAAIRVKVS